MALKDVLRRLRREASRDAVLIHQRDGSVRAFDKMTVMTEVFLAKFDAALGSPRRSSDVLDALDGATPESRRTVEEMCRSGRCGRSGFTGDLDLEPREPVEPVEDLSDQAGEPL